MNNPELKKEFMRCCSAVGITVIAALVPPLVAVKLFGVVAVFNWFINDAFYYLTIARNATLQLPTTFDGVMPTNGFHPFWQYILIVVVKLAGQDQERQLLAAFVACSMAWAAGIGFAAYAVYRLTHSLFASLWLLPGIVWLVFKLLLPPPIGMGLLDYSPSAWAFVNGMESSWSFLFGGALLALFATRATADVKIMWSDRFCLGVGVVALACILVRLDDVFLIPALWVYALLYAKERRFRAIVLMTLPVLLGLAAYFASNLLQGLPLLPVSGATKAKFSLALNNYTVIHSMIYPYLSGDWHTWETDFGYDGAIRTSLIGIPFLITSLLLVDWVKQTRGRSVLVPPPEVVLYPVLVYVILKSVYNFSNVVFMHQGHWYYALIYLMLNVILVVVFHNRVVQRSKTAGIALASLWLGIYILCMSEILWKSRDETGPNYAVWQNRDEVRTALLGINPDIKLIDFSDAVIAYALNLPTISGTGLTSDAEGYRIIKSGGYGAYLEYCISRGFTVGAGGTGLYSWPVNKSYIDAEMYTNERAGLFFHALKLPDRRQQK